MRKDYLKRTMLLIINNGRATGWPDIFPHAPINIFYIIQSFWLINCATNHHIYVHMYLLRKKFSICTRMLEFNFISVFFFKISAHLFCGYVDTPATIRRVCYKYRAGGRARARTNDTKFHSSTAATRKSNKFYSPENCTRGAKF